MIKLNIYQKLLKIRSELSVIRKDKKNPYYNSNYADINTVLEVIIPKLAEYNLLLLQRMDIKDGQDVIVTEIIDCEDESTGKKIKDEEIELTESIKSITAVKTIKQFKEEKKIDKEKNIITHTKTEIENDPQKFGSGITYSRRYALISLLALEQEDDDANLASHNKNSLGDREKHHSHPSNSSLASEKQINYLVSLIANKKLNQEEVLSSQGISKLDELTKYKASKLINSLANNT